MGCITSDNFSNKNNEIKSNLIRGKNESNEPILEIEEENNDEKEADNNLLTININNQINDIKKIKELEAVNENANNNLPTEVIRKLTPSIHKNNKLQLNSNMPIRPVIGSEFKFTNFTSQIKERFCDSPLEKPVLTQEDKEMLNLIFTNHFLFKNKTAKTIESIIESLEMEKVPKGRILFKKGDKSNDFFIIKEGQIEIEVENNITKILTKGETFGELALLQNAKRTATVRTIEQCILLVLNGKKFREKLMEISEKELGERLVLLKSTAIFNVLDSIKLNTLTTGMIECSYEEGHMIIRKNEIAQNIYIIKSGYVECLKGEKDLVRILGPKDYFGEGAVLFNEGKRSLSVQVKETVECFQISESFLRETLGIDFNEVILSSIIKNALNNSKYMKHFSNDIYFKIIMENRKFISYEDDDEVLSNDTKKETNSKFYVVLSGNMIDEDKEIVATRGQLFGDQLLKYEVNPSKSIYANDELKVIEFDWNLIFPKFRINVKKNKIFSLFSKVDNLKKISLFKETEINKLVQIVMMMKKLSYDKNKIIFHQGETGNKLYMIKKGRVQIFKNKKYIRELGEGACFGELALLYDEPRSATIKTVEPTIIFYLTKDDFSSLVDENMFKYLAKKISLEDGNVTLLENLFFVKNLGHGKFGNVCLVHNKKNYFAIKAVSRKAAEKQKVLIKYIIQERNILLTLENPFIMKLVKTFKTEDNIFFLLEYISGRAMSKYLNLRTQKQLMNEKETIFYIATLLVALNYLKSRNVCHRDLKPDNIIIDENGYLKLIDFGNSKIIDQKTKTHTITGTPHYIAPEILLGYGYGLTCDYWSLGIIAYEVYFGSHPFGKNAKDPIEVYKEIVKKNLVFTRGDANIIELIKGLLVKNENERVCSLEKAKTMDAFKDFLWDELLEFKMVPNYIPKKLELKEFKDYPVKYLKYLKEIGSKNQENEDLLSSYDEDDVDCEYDENWADIF